MQTTAQLRSLPFSSSKTYIFAALFVLGNIILPQICHLIPNGGHIWLPIYFFTLVGAYTYGWRVGILTAIASPLVNSFIFGMPAPVVLPSIMLKSLLLASAAGIAASRTAKTTLLNIAAVVLAYQTIGTLGEWALAGNFSAAISDFTLGLPGIALQILGGWAVIRFLSKLD